MQETEQALSDYSEVDFQAVRDSWGVREQSERVILFRTTEGVVVYHCRSGAFWAVAGWRPAWSEMHGFVSEFPEMKQFPKQIWTLDGDMIKKGHIADLVRSAKGASTVMVVPTTRCACDCKQCYSAKGPVREIPSSRVMELLKRITYVRSVIVFGGESLFYDDLAERMMDVLVKDAGVCFVTGMGFTEEDFVARARRVVLAGANLTLSIDPPPKEGEDYTRSYAGSKGREWYVEQLARLSIISHNAIRRVDKDNPRAVKIGDQTVAAMWGIRPTIGPRSVDFRQLRRDIQSVTGWAAGLIAMNAQPEVCGENFPKEFFREVRVLFQKDVCEITEGRLNLTLNQHWRDPFWDTLNLSSWGLNGGCYSYWDRVSLGPQGELTFCNESPTWKDGSEWNFQDSDWSIDITRYGQVMDKMYEGPEKCKRCEFRHLCGVVCPVNLFKGNNSACMFTRIKAMSLLRLIVDSMGMEQLVKWANAKFTRMWSAPYVKLTVKDWEERGKRLLS